MTEPVPEGFATWDEYYAADAANFLAGPNIASSEQISKAPWQPRPLPEIALGEPTHAPDRFHGLLYSGLEALVSGEPGVGKSMVLAAILTQAVTAGEPVLYLDFERTAGMLYERLTAFGLSQEELGRVLYLRPTLKASPAEIRDMVANHQPSLVAVDSYDAALAAFGYETKNEDIRAFHLDVIDPLKSTGASVLIADHVAKNRDLRGRYSIGGQAKLALAEVHLGLSAIIPLRRGSGGKLKVQIHKDNPGHLPRSATFALVSDEQLEALSWSVSADADGDDRADGFRPTALMERVSRYVEGAGEPRSRNQIETDVEGKREYVRLAIDVLVREGFLGEDVGPRKARMLIHLNRYHEADEEAERVLERHADIAGGEEP